MHQALPLHVLVIDDDHAQRVALRRVLERGGFVVSEAATAMAALCAAVEDEIDIALVDVHLPDMSGLELLGRLRQIVPDAHLVVVSGAGTEADLLRGFGAGADDYLTKPVSLLAVVARLQAIARRRVQPTAGADVLKVGELTIDPRARRVWRGDVEVDLPRLEFDLLTHLAHHAGRAFSRQELLEAVWRSSSEWQSTATVTEHVRRLRLKLEVDPTKPVLIETLPGVGYRFVGSSTEGLPTAGAPITARAGGAMAIIEGQRIVFATEALAHLAGAKTIAEVVGHDVFEFVAPESVERTKARQAIMNDGGRLRPEILALRRKDGTDVDVEITSTSVLYRGVMARQVVLWPAEAASLHQRVTGIHTEVADGIIVCNADFVIQSFNRAAEELYGWSESEVVGRNIIDVIPWEGSEEDLAIMADRLLVGGRWHGEISQRRRDGSTLVVAATTTLIRDANGVVAGVIGVNRPLAVDAPRGSRASSPDADLVVDIRRGIAANEFEVHYQPIVEIEHRSVIAVESLVRWRHPTRGLLLPESFIEAAEASGAIIELGRFVLETACDQAKQWRVAGHDLGVGVNVSTRQLADEGLVNGIEALIAESEMPWGSLCLEMTETALVEDLDRAEAVIGRLKALGAQVAIDDFGTGWASLTYLHQFPVQSLKVDRIFVSGLGVSANDTAIVRSIVSLGGELGLDVVAEGVETEEQLEHLRSLGCTLAQGYLFGRPVRAEDLDLTSCSAAHSTADHVIVA